MKILFCIYLLIILLSFNGCEHNETGVGMVDTPPSVTLTHVYHTDILKTDDAKATLYNTSAANMDNEYILSWESVYTEEDRIYCLAPSESFEYAFLSV